jgi:hypothetical protein
VHCGFYDEKVGNGIFESHTDFFVIGSTFAEAREKARANSSFKEMRMHIDGLIHIKAVDGFKIECIQGAEGAQTELVSHKYRDLAPKVSKDN